MSLAVRYSVRLSSTPWVHELVIKAKLTRAPRLVQLSLSTPMLVVLVLRPANFSCFYLTAHREYVVATRRQLWNVDIDWVWTAAWGQQTRFRFRCGGCYTVGILLRVIDKYVIEVVICCVDSAAWAAVSVVGLRCVVAEPLWIAP
jgi:hypothetical protein